MPTTVNLTTTYAGEVAGGYLLPAFLSAESLNHITVKDRIPYKQKVRRMTDNATTFADPACTFTPSGTITLDERTITLVDMAYERELCKLTFLPDWEALAAQNGDISTVADALVLTMMGNIGQILEPMIWSGTAGTGSFDGLITQIDADNTVNFVPTAIPLTANNILAKITLLIAELPTRVKSQAERPVIYMNQVTWEYYMAAQIAAGNGWYATAGPEVPKTWMGLYTIAVCPGMPDNTMIMAQPSNLWFGTNVVADMNNINVIDMEPVNLDRTVRFAATFYGATQYGFGNEISAYGPGLS